MKLKNQFHDQIFISEIPQYESKLDEVDYYNLVLKMLLFGGDEENQSETNKVISFQQLKGEFGCFWAYNYFFGIDLKIALDKQKDNYIEHLTNCFQIRHRIIHGSAKVSLFKEEIDSDMLKKNEKIILFIRQNIK